MDLLSKKVILFPFETLSLTSSKNWLKVCRLLYGFRLILWQLQPEVGWNFMVETFVSKTKKHNSQTDFFLRIYDSLLIK